MRNLLVGLLVIAVVGVPGLASEADDLAKKLGAKDAGKRREAAEKLSELGKEAKAALPADLYGTIEAAGVDPAMPGLAVVRLDITAAGDATPLRRLFQMLMRRDAAIWAVGPAL